MLTKIIFFSLVCFSVFAQSEHLSGAVSDTQQKPLAGATIILFSTKDSSIVISVFSDSVGRFSFNLPKGSYWLHTRLIGYKEANHRIAVPYEHGALDITLSEDAITLQEASVKAQRNSMEYEAGKTLVRPTIAISTNLWDTLKGIPGLVLNEDGTILLNGESGINIQINGKDTFLSGMALVSFLKTLASNTVDIIEIQNQPSAEQSAAGKAGIINIRTKKWQTEGLALSSYLNFQQGKNLRGDGGIRVGIRRKKTTLNFDYAHFSGQKAKHGYLNRSYANQSAESAVQEISLVHQDKTHNIKLNLEANISKAITLDAYAGLMIFDRNIPGSSHTTFLTLPAVNAITHNNYLQTNLNGGLRGIYKNERKQELNLSLDGLTLRHTEKMDMKSQRVKTNPIWLQGDFNDKISILSGQINYSQPINPSINLQSGIKYTQVDIRNQALYQQDEIFTLQRSSVYNYQEKISAGYLQLSGKYKKWSFVSGLRVENTNITGQLSLPTDSLTGNRYTNFFPNVSFMYSPHANHDLAIQFNKRITRPNYRDLSPASYTIDEYIIIRGNSALQAEISQQIELSYILKKRYKLSTSYSFVDKAIAQGFRERANGGLWIIPENLASRKNYGIRLDASDCTGLKWWQLNASASLIFMRNNWQELTNQLTSSSLSPSLSISNNFALGKGWHAQFTAYYFGKMAFGQMELPTRWSASGSIRKKLIKDKLNINLYMNDIFASVREQTYFRSGNIRGYSDIRYDETTVGISVQFNFNQQKTENRTIEEGKRINF